MTKTYVRSLLVTFMLSTQLSLSAFSMKEEENPFESTHTRQITTTESSKKIPTEDLRLLRRRIEEFNQLIERCNRMLDGKSSLENKDDNMSKEDEVLYRMGDWRRAMNAFEREKNQDTPELLEMRRQEIEEMKKTLIEECRVLKVLLKQKKSENESRKGN
jgi:membrane-associated HD superfamily phosphohydrolase